ncbi:MAG: helix-turn-helix domain-containing protein [Clostridia bacterium]|nr:helix-turn-helix domain-containing protein [Clostridia bacterium]
MDWDRELSFLREVLEKCHIHTSILSGKDGIGSAVEPRLNSVSDYFSKTDATIESVLGKFEEKTKYVLSNEFKLKYVCLLLPVKTEKNILFIGPYISSAISSKDILEIGEKASLSPSSQKILKEYYSSLPIITENDHIFALIDAFCERIWNTGSFAIVESKKVYASPLISASASSKGESTEEILANVEMMEMRYDFENRLIRAVTLGQQHKESLLAVAFNEQLFEKRLSDPVRNGKNYCIIMNTLLRKAAENGGVHPVYIDRLSSKFASRIEQLTDAKKISEIMREMFSSYCRLVHKHATSQYSPIVKKTVIVIDSDISAELSLGTLAEKQGVSSGYLATIFKKETGKTISEYVRHKRIEHAKYLLSTTHLQIQTVALHCGIMDVQYFSKIFKKQIGKTPKEYREAIKASAQYN